MRPSHHGCLNLARAQRLGSIHVGSLAAPKQPRQLTASLAVYCSLCSVSQDQDVPPQALGAVIPVQVSSQPYSKAGIFS